MLSAFLKLISCCLSGSVSNLYLCDCAYSSNCKLIVYASSSNKAKSLELSVRKMHVFHEHFILKYSLLINYSTKMPHFKDHENIRHAEL